MASACRSPSNRVVRIPCARAREDQFDHIGNRQRKQLCAFMIYYRRPLYVYGYRVNHLAAEWRQMYEVPFVLCMAAAVCVQQEIDWNEIERQIAIASKPFSRGNYCWGWRELRMGTMIERFTEYYVNPLSFSNHGSQRASRLVSFWISDLRNFISPKIDNNWSCGVVRENWIHLRATPSNEWENGKITAFNDTSGLIIRTEPDST